MDRDAIRFEHNSHPGKLKVPNLAAFKKFLYEKESEEALNQWLVRYPELKDKPHGTAEQALAEIKRQQKT